MAFLLPLVMALVPLLITPGLSFHYDLVPKVALLAFAAAIAVCRPGFFPEISRLRGTRFGRWLCLLAASQVLWTAVASLTSSRILFSVFGSNWRRFGLITIAALCIIVVSAAAWLREHQGTERHVLRAQAVAAIGVSLYTIAQYFGVDPLQNGAGYRAQDGDIAIVRPPGTLGHADYLGWWLAITIFLCWGLYRVEQRIWRNVALAGTILSGVAIVFSGTRSAIAAVVVGFAFLIVGGRVAATRKHLLTGAAVVLAAGVFYLSPPGQMLRARVKWSSDEAPGGARPLLWRDSLKMAAAHPLTGFGPETFAAEFPRFQSEDLSRLVPDFYHESPHNAGLDAATSEGLPGLIIVLGWLALGIAAIRTRDGKAPMEAALAGAFVASFVASLFNSITIATALATLGVLAMLTARRAEPQAAPVNWPRPFAIAAAVPIAATLAVFGAVLLHSDSSLECFSRIVHTRNPGAVVTAYKGIRMIPDGGAFDDLFCSRRLAAVCGLGTSAISRLQCSQAATQAAARATITADNPPNAWYNLAMFAAAHNDARGAEKALRTAASLAPNWFRPHWALANYLTLTGRANEARAEMRRALYLNAADSRHLNEALQPIAQAH
jgi:O-antigen ligase